MGSLQGSRQQVVAERPGHLRPPKDRTFI